MKKRIFQSVFLGLPTLILIFGTIWLFYVGIDFFNGFVPPGTGIFSLGFFSRGIIQFEKNLPSLIIFWCLCGAAISWFSIIAKPENKSSSQICSIEIRLVRLLKKWGLLLIIFLFLISLGRAWTNSIKVCSEDVTPYSALLGFVPWSDAHNYHSGAFHLADTGELDSFNQRRPLNATLLSVRLALSRYNLHGATVLQVLFLAFASYLSVRIIAAYKGIWSALLMLALLLSYGRFYQATVLSETLGLSLGAISFSLLFYGVFEKHVHACAFGLFGLALGMGARAGALFMLPFLFIWLCWFFRNSLKKWTKNIFVLFFAVLIGLALPFLLNSMYGTDESYVGANFASTACGLAYGVSWHGAEEKFESELNKLHNEKEKSAFLFRQALVQICDHPQTLLKELLRGEYLFIRSFEWFIRGLLFPNFHVKFIIFLLESIIGIGFLLYIRRVFRSAESGFWLACASGFLLSIPFIFADGGLRVISTSWPFICAFIASMITSPRYFSTQTHKDSLSLPVKLGITSLVAISLSALIGPWIVTNSYNRPEAKQIIQPFDDWTVVISSKALKSSAVAVISQNDQIIAHVPNISLSEYEKSIIDSNIEDKKSLIPAPQTPFLLFLGYDFSSKKSLHLVGPVELLNQKSPFIRLMVQQWRNSRYFRHVVDFQALPCS